ncbi:MAG TPA: CBS domain-containing protein [Acidimicrobiia bacterium]|nr:CBS domain-containing protein [Acidimicrobiia bacterium]
MAGDVLVRDVMSTTLFSLGPDTKVEEAADVLADHRVSAVPVVDADGTLVGMLRDDDLIASEARVHVPTVINFLGLGVPFPGEMKHLEAELKKIAGAAVKDVMDGSPPSARGDQTVEDIATLMHDHGINSVPVVDDANKVIGVVARGDIVRLIARTT